MKDQTVCAPHKNFIKNDDPTKTDLRELVAHFDGYDNRKYAYILPRPDDISTWEQKLFWRSEGLGWCYTHLASDEASQQFLARNMQCPNVYNETLLADIKQLVLTESLVVTTNIELFGSTLHFSPGEQYNVAELVRAWMFGFPSGFGPIPPNFVGRVGSSVTVDATIAENADAPVQDSDAEDQTPPTHAPPLSRKQVKKLQYLNKERSKLDARINKILALLVVLPAVSAAPLESRRSDSYVMTLVVALFFLVPWNTLAKLVERIVDKLVKKNPNSSKLAKAIELVKATFDEEAPNIRAEMGMELATPLFPIALLCWFCSMILTHNFLTWRFKKKVAEAEAKRDAAERTWALQQNSDFDMMQNSNVQFEFLIGQRPMQIQLFFVNSSTVITANHLFSYNTKSQPTLTGLATGTFKDVVTGVSHIVSRKLILDLKSAWVIPDSDLVMLRVPDVFGTLPDWSDRFFDEQPSGFFVCDWHRLRGFESLNTEHAVLTVANVDYPENSNKNSPKVRLPRAYVITIGKPSRYGDCGSVLVHDKGIKQICGIYVAGSGTGCEGYFCPITTKDVKLGLSYLDDLDNSKRVRFFSIRAEMAETLPQCPTRRSIKKTFSCLQSEVRAFAIRAEMDRRPKSYESQTREPGTGLPGRVVPEQPPLSNLPSDPSYPIDTGQSSGRPENPITSVNAPGAPSANAVCPETHPADNVITIGAPPQEMSNGSTLIPGQGPRDASPSNFAWQEREVLIGSVDMAVGVFSTTKFYPVETILNDMVIKNTLRFMNTAVFSVEVRAEISSSTNHSGRVMMGYVPCNDSYDVPGLTELSNTLQVAQRCGLPYVDLGVGIDESYPVLTIPFTYDHASVALAQDYHAGVFRYNPPVVVTTVVPMGHALGLTSAVTLTIYAKLTNLQLGGNTSLQAEAGEIPSEPFSSKVSAISNAASKVEPFLDAWPPLALPVEIGQLALNGIAGIARFFGHSRPIDQTVQAVIQVSTPALCPANTNVRGKTLAMDVDQGVSVDAQLAGTKWRYEMDFPLTGSKPYYVGSCPWSSTDPLGKMLMRINVSPAGGVLDGEHAILTGSQLICAHFNSWVGVMHYEISIVAPPGMGGKLIISYDPNGNEPEYTINKAIIIDLKLTRKIMIPVLWNQNRGLLTTNLEDLQYNVGIGDAELPYFSQLHNGRLFFQVQQAVLPPGDKDVQVTLLVKQWADREMMYCNPNPNGLRNYVIDNPDDTMLNAGVRFAPAMPSSLVRDLSLVGSSNAPLFQMENLDGSTAPSPAPAGGPTMMPTPLQCPPCPTSSGPPSAVLTGVPTPVYTPTSGSVPPVAGLPATPKPAVTAPVSSPFNILASFKPTSKPVSTSQAPAASVPGPAPSPAVPAPFNETLGCTYGFVPADPRAIACMGLKQWVKTSSGWNIRHLPHGETALFATYVGGGGISGVRYFHDGPNVSVGGRASVLQPDGTYMSVFNPGGTEGVLRSTSTGYTVTAETRLLRVDIKFNPGMMLKTFDHTNFPGNFSLAQNTTPWGEVMDSVVIPAGGSAQIPYAIGPPSCVLPGPKVPVVIIFEGTTLVSDLQGLNPFNRTNADPGGALVLLPGVDGFVTIYNQSSTAPLYLQAVTVPFYTGVAYAPPVSGPASTPSLRPELSTLGPSTALPLKPTRAPTGKPITSGPTIKPTGKPVTANPTGKPTGKPVTLGPTGKPTGKPITSKPTVKPITAKPTSGPTTMYPTLLPIAGRCNVALSWQIPTAAWCATSQPIDSDTFQLNAGSHTVSFATVGANAGRPCLLEFTCLPGSSITSTSSGSITVSGNLVTISVPVNSGFTSLTATSVVLAVLGVATLIRVKTFLPVNSRYVLHKNVNPSSAYFALPVNGGGFLTAARLLPGMYTTFAVPTWDNCPLVNTITTMVMKGFLKYGIGYDAAFLNTSYLQSTAFTHPLPVPEFYAHNIATYVYSATILEGTHINRDLRAEAGESMEQTDPMSATFVVGTHVPSSEETARIYVGEDIQSLLQLLKQFSPCGGVRDITNDTTFEVPLYAGADATLPTVWNLLFLSFYGVRGGVVIHYKVDSGDAVLEFFRGTDFNSTFPTSPNNRGYEMVNTRSNQRSVAIHYPYYETNRYQATRGDQISLVKPLRGVTIKNPSGDFTLEWDISAGEDFSLIGFMGAPPLRRI